MYDQFFLVFLNIIGVLHRNLYNRFLKKSCKTEIKGITIMILGIFSEKLKNFLKEL